jgi:hypothetical protein
MKIHVTEQGSISQNNEMKFQNGLRAMPDGGQMVKLMTIRL